MRLIVLFDEYKILYNSINSQLFSGVEVKFKHFVYPILILPTQIKEMKEITELDDAMRIGASVTLVEMEDVFRHQMTVKPGKI